MIPKNIGQITVSQSPRHLVHVDGRDAFLMTVLKQSAPLASHRIVPAGWESCSKL